MPQPEQPAPAGHDQPAASPLEAARALHRAGRIAEAEQGYASILRANPQEAEALHLLGVIALQSGRPADGTGLISRAIGLRPGHAQAHNNLGYGLSQLGRAQDALASFTRAAELDPGFLDARMNQAGVLMALGRAEEALAAYGAAIAGSAAAPAPLMARAALLLSLGRAAPALADLDAAAALGLASLPLHAARARALAALDRLEDSLAAFDRALALEQGNAELWNDRGVVLNRLSRPALALTSFDRAIALAPALAAAHANRGLALHDLRRNQDAIQALDRAIALRPEAADAYLNRGTVLAALWQDQEALASYDAALARDPTLAAAHYSRGHVLTRLRRPEDAARAFAEALRLDPAQDLLRGHALHARLRLHDWRGLEEALRALEAAVARGEFAASPLHFLTMLDKPALHLRLAMAQAREHDAVRTLPSLPTSAPCPRPARLRLGYFSADFHAHAVAYLLAGVIEQHDRSRFEVTGFSFGPPADDAMRQRLVAGFDRFIEVNDRSDADVALLAREMGIDIAIDLTAYTGNCRPGIFANRAAPVQVNWLGYPGTMGAGWMDWIIADRTVLPEAAQVHYAERVAYLPHCYQPNDDRRAIAETCPGRAEQGLPEDAVVFCAFNAATKLLPECFDSWARILRAVPGSVLWLIQDSATAQANLRREAAARGVAPERLVFAPVLDLPQHLARHRLADLFLDTWPYNGHTTASDALWAGLPVLTCPGENFAARVAASLLHAIGLPELVAADAAGFEALAISLAREPARLAALRQRLAANRTTMPLFDTRRFTRDLEALFDSISGH